MLIVSSTVRGKRFLHCPVVIIFGEKGTQKIARSPVCKREVYKDVYETKCEMQLCSVLVLMVSELALVSNVAF